MFLIKLGINNIDEWTRTLSFYIKISSTWISTFTVKPEDSQTAKTKSGQTLLSMQPKKPWVILKSLPYTLSINHEKTLLSKILSYSLHWGRSDTREEEKLSSMRKQTMLLCMCYFSETWLWPEKIRFTDLLLIQIFFEVGRHTFNPDHLSWTNLSVIWATLSAESQSKEMEEGSFALCLLAFLPP